MLKHAVRTLPLKMRQEVSMHIKWVLFVIVLISFALLIVLFESRCIVEMVKNTVC